MEPESKPSNPHWREIERILRQGGLYKSNTLDTYKLAVGYLRDFDPKTMTQADLDGIKDDVLRNRKGNGPRIVLMCLKATLRRVYGRHELILKVPKYKRRTKDVLEVEEVQALLASMRSDKLMHAVFLTEYDCLLRPSEVGVLNVEDFDFGKREVKIRDSKTGDGVVNLSDRASAALQAWFAERPDYRDKQGRAAFISHDNLQRIGVHYLKYNLRRKAAQAGITRRVYPHMLRASGITHLLNLGVNPAIVQQQARHSNVQTTWIYNRPTMNDQRRLLDRAWGPVETKTVAPEALMQEAVKRAATGDISLQELRSLLNLTQAATGIRPPGNPGETGYA